MRVASSSLTIEERETDETVAIAVAVREGCTMELIFIIRTGV